MTTSVEMATVTPGTAEQWLRCNYEGQRRMKRATVAKWTGYINARRAEL